MEKFLGRLKNIMLCYTHSFIRLCLREIIEQFLDMSDWSKGERGYWSSYDKGKCILIPSLCDGAKVEVTETWNVH